MKINYEELNKLCNSNVKLYRIMMNNIYEDKAISPKQRTILRSIDNYSRTKVVKEKQAKRR